MSSTRVAQVLGTTLAAGVMAVAVLVPAGVLQAEPVWCSPFETENGVAVTHEQVAGPVENLVGPEGQATGSIASLAPLVYVQYGVALPGIPGLIDPGNAAGSFGISSPDDRRTGINSNLRSDAGNLGSALTFEGYFYVPTATPVGGTFAGQRLISQKRSSDDGQSRLAVGLQAVRVGVVEGLFDYEGFDYTGTAIHGLSGGIGWGGAWDDTDGDFGFLSNDSVSLSSPLFTSVGSRLSGPNAGATGTIEGVRPLSVPLNLSEEGKVLYVSGLLRKGSISANSGENLEISFTAGTTTQVARFGITSGSATVPDAFFLNPSTNLGPPVTAGTTYLVIGKIVAHTAANDEFFMNVYASGDSVPTTEPETWMLTNQTASNSVLSHLRLVVGANNNKGEIDEIRIGSTYAAVTDPNAPLGDSGELRNVLSTFWVESVPPVPPAVDPTLANHLEVGSTPLEANTWYHFAAIHDGTTLTWYLNGALEGTAGTPGIVAPGTAKIAIGNNRTSGATNDRGFYGVMDEIRLWDRALTVDELAVKGGATGAGLLWRSRFETNDGQAVTSGQPAETPGCIDNSAGSPDGTPAGVVASLYVQYGQTGVPAIPALIDPGALAQSFAISLPDLQNTAVNTMLPSNAGNLADALTVQGYFNHLSTVVDTGMPIGDRLVSMMRSASEGQSRLAIGLTGNTEAAPTNNVLAIVWAEADTSTLTVVRGTTAVQPNTWYHFAMVYDGTDIRFYLDGTLQGEVLAPNLMGPGSAPIAIGNDRTAGNGTRGFYGLLDKIVISDHVIAPTEFMTAGVGFDPCLGMWCNVPFADDDNDDDVDMDDFGAFQRCFSETPGIPNECKCFDRDGDEDVDVTDFGAFKLCATGPGIVWTATPGCPQ